MPLLTRAARSVIHSVKKDMPLRLKDFALVVGALFILAACETASTEQSASSGDGGSSAQSSGSSGGGQDNVRQAPSSSGGFQIAPGSRQDFVINVGDRVFFDFDKSNLKPEARATLEKQAAWLKRYPAVRVTVEGHCDERGTREYNLALGERRANSAKDFLVALGISPNRIETVSYGKERPVALGHNEASWSQNRRAVTVPTGGLPGT